MGLREHLRTNRSRLDLKLASRTEFSIPGPSAHSFKWLIKDGFIGLKKFNYVFDYLFFNLWFFYSLFFEFFSHRRLQSLIFSFNLLISLILLFIASFTSLYAGISYLCAVRVHLHVRSSARIIISRCNRLIFNIIIKHNSQRLYSCSFPRQK